MTPLIVVGAVVLLGLFIAALARGGFISAGEAGERAVSAILREDLDQHRYKVLDNIMLKTNKGITTQIDHIVVSQYGVFVIETKNISGWVFASERGRQWTQTLPAWDGFGSAEKYHFQNPLRQNYLHTMTLAYQLRIPKRHIFSLVAFPSDTEFKKGYPQGVYTYGEIPNAILAHKEPVFDVKTTRSIANAIQAADALITEDERRMHVSNVRLVHGQFD